MARLYFDIFPQAIDSNGNPISGAKLYFYTTGTTTPKNTYSDSGLTTPNTNPVVADSAGRFGAIYLATDADYKVVLKDASDSTLETRDPLLLISTSVIAHQGSLIIGDSLAADSELLIGAADTTLRSDGTTAAWRAANYTVQKFLSGSGTYSRPDKCTAIRVRVVGGGGGGGGGGGSTAPAGSVGGNSSFNSVVATGGSGGSGNTSIGAAAGGAGGTGGTGTATQRFPGTDGGSGIGFAGGLEIAGKGGDSAFFSGGAAQFCNSSGTGATGGAGATNTGGGGGGARGGAGVAQAGGGGGGGESFELIILNPSASYAYAVGGGGAGGVGTGTGAVTGGAGANGIVIVEEFYF